MNQPPQPLADWIATGSSAPGILPDDSLAEAGLKSWRFHFAEVLQHEPGTRLGEDSEALHDMRVATRRLRASFDVFGSAFDPKLLKSHLKGLRATGRALGRVRDMDVFVEKAHAYQERLPARQQASLLPLLQAWQAERLAARQALITYLDGEDYRQFQRSFVAFLQPDKIGILVQEAANPSIRLIIPGLVYSCLNTVLDYESILPFITIPQLHTLRIEFKKLRYTVEFFREVLGKPAIPVIKLFKGLQDHLGDLQDADVACGVLRSWLIRWDELQADLPLQKRSGPGGVLTYLAHQYAIRQQMMMTFPHAWEGFTQPAFQQSMAAMIAKLQSPA